MKKFVLSGYFGFKNFGDEAILDVILSKIKTLENSITVITSNPTYTKEKHPEVNCIKTFDLLNIVKKIVTSDILISGGGSLLQDKTSLKSLLYYLFVIFVGLFFKKKVIIFAQGIGPINNNFGKFLTKNILKHCSYITVRDEKSFELLNSWDIKNKLVCDPIFSIEVPRVSPKEPIVGVQLRNFKTMNEDFLNRLAQKICEEFPDKKIEIYSFQDSIDKEICLNFQNKISSINPNIKTEVFSELTNTQIIDLLAKNEYLIGMRFHSIIVGLLARTKILAINYDIKVEKIAAEFNLPLIDLANDFDNAFEILKNQTSLDASSKTFDWQDFLSHLN